MVLKDNVGDLASDELRAKPPREATIDLYQSLWGTASDCVPGLPERDPRRDGEVNPFTTTDVLKGIKRLKPGGTPGQDDVISSYPPLTPCHNMAIQRVLLSHGGPRCLSSIVGLMYAGGTTILGTLGVTISLRGVKQGHPL
ncbi:hypothetical protein J6590_089799 [Homalodisca vitripennis]|nr:hypothetical protein J6590_089799 [Homalodisca vitripennis]